MSAAGEQGHAKSAAPLQPGRLWSLWDMLELEVGRLLDAHEKLTVDRGFFERAAKELEKHGVDSLPMDVPSYNRLCNAVVELEKICRDANLVSTQQAAARLKKSFELAELARPNKQSCPVFSAYACRKAFHHLMDIISRLRDDCKARLYFQIAPENTDLMREDVAHFGPKVERVFWPANEDIAEAAACLALGRTTGCVFHLMRAMETAVFLMAKRLRVRRKDQNGRLRTWGQLLPSIGTKIEAMKHSPKKDDWLQARALLFAVNRSWRIKVAHGASDLRPKETYTEEQAQVCFDTSKAFMNYLADLIEK